MMNDAEPIHPDPSPAVADATTVEPTTQADVPATAEMPPPEGDAAPGEAPDLAAELAEAQRQRDDYLNSWKRAAADFQNFKKREEKMRGERERAANSRLLTRLLPILDDLQRAASHAPEGGENEWIRGVLAIENKLGNLLQQEGVSEIEAAPGTLFDPTVHEAIITLPGEGIEAGHIVETLERGYRLHDLVLRPARVAVAP